MSQAAAHVVEHALALQPQRSLAQEVSGLFLPGLTPHMPVRQWVLLFADSILKLRFIAAPGLFFGGGNYSDAGGAGGGGAEVVAAWPPSPHSFT
jgi:hypothetical protein